MLVPFMGSEVAGDFWGASHESSLVLRLLDFTESRSLYMSVLLVPKCAIAYNLFNQILDLLLCCIP